MIIKAGDIQIMSAGTGVDHSEYNHSNREPAEFLQIWIRPKKMNIAPRYEQKFFDLESRKNTMLTVVGPDKERENLWINQDAWFHLGMFEKGKDLGYSLHRTSDGVYIFVLEGNLRVSGEELKRGDGMGISGIAAFDIHITEHSTLLLIEVPMSEDDPST